MLTSNNAPNYSLEIISHHPDPQFKGKNLRKYHVSGIDTVGAYGNEPFEIVFKNNTFCKVQVKLSIDGTDLLTGGVADTEVSKDMWIVNGYSSLSIKAWPENSKGGAQLVFTNAGNSVAVHTHGNLSSRGIIAAAVYTESYTYTSPYYGPYYVWLNYNWWNYPAYPAYPLITINGTYGSCSGMGAAGSLANQLNYNNCSNSIGSSGGGTTSSASYSCNNVSSTTFDNSLQSAAGVGAGQYVEQNISYTAGLVQPALSETVKVRFLWWDDLLNELRSNNVPAPHASGFPGDTKHYIMNIGNTPRIGDFNEPMFVKAPIPVYDRV